MVAALDDSADEKARATTGGDRPQTIAAEDSAVSTFLKANLPRVETASEGLAETLPQPGIQLAQASAVLAHAVTAAGQEAAPGAATDSNSGTASVAAHSWHSKPGAAGRPATAKSTPLQAGLPPLNDGSTAIAAQFFQPVQPAMMAKAPAGSASQLSTVYPPNANAAARPVILPSNQGSRVSVPNGAIPGQKTEPSMQDGAGDLLETPASAADRSPASHLVIASHSPETTVDPLALTNAGQASSQPTVSSKGVSGVIPVEPSTSSAVDNAAVSSLSSVSDAETVKPQIAAARAGSGPGSVRVNRSVDSQLNPATVDGMHGQLNGAAAGSAVVRDTASVLPSNPGPGASAQIASSMSTADTFSALDGASGSMRPTWIHAGAHQAEAGFEDPALGWVSVRAGVNAGGISAVVVPGSTDATEALGAHMAGLHDYLAEQHSPVETLTLGMAVNSGTDAGLSQGMQNQGQQQSAQDNTANAPAMSSIQPAARAAVPTQATHMSSDESPAVQLGSGGRHISVMA
jgi:hypothetical protein